jgi:hypothetical protein
MMAESFPMVPWWCGFLCEVWLVTQSRAERWRWQRGERGGNAAGAGEAKFWLEPEIRLAGSYHYSSKALRDIAAIIEAHHDELIRAWQEQFGN